jgi:hypothetical protein
MVVSTAHIGRHHVVYRGCLVRGLRVFPPVHLRFMACRVSIHADKAIGLVAGGLLVPPWLGRAQGCVDGLCEICGRPPDIDCVDDRCFRDVRRLDHIDTVGVNG